MKRISLQTFRGERFSPDTLQAIQKLEEAAFRTHRWKLTLLRPASKLLSPQYDLQSGGREVYFQLNHSAANPTLQNALEALWGYAIPLGFTPKARYPILTGSPEDYCFHYFGCWQALYDRLIAEGRGHVAFSSVCIASQVDCGEWKGSQNEVRFLQAQLHRVGFNVGAIDGVVGPRMTKVFETLGFKKTASIQALTAQVLAMDASQRKKKSTNKVQVVSEKPFQVSVYGPTYSVRSQHGVVLDVRGKSKVVLDFE